MRKIKTKLFSLSLPQSLRLRIEKYRTEKIALSIGAIIISAIDEYLERKGY